LALIVPVGLVAQLLLGQPAAHAQASAPTQPVDHFDLPVDIEVPIQPIPVKGADGKWYLVYHLFLTNWSFSTLTLKSVEVTDPERGTLLTRYQDRELKDLYRFRSILPTPARLEISSEAALRQLGSGRTGVLFFWLTLDATQPVPSRLSHRFVFEPNPLIRLLRDAPPDPGGGMVLEDFTVRVSADKPLVIGPPLRGGGWNCGNGPAHDTAHQYLTLRGGKVRIAQRFAFDFAKVDERGDRLPSPFPDDITNEMFYGYGAEVLAVSDGVIAFVKDGIPENVPQASGETKAAVPITRETVSGNWVSIDLGANRYAFYAHLQPGSIRVKVGDKVRKGQAIGLLGNSGNTSGPHLHFHLGDANSLNGCEGIPFVFESFEVVGPSGRHALEIPLDQAVVRFP
jgi:biotin carboxyl carrier protein